MGAKFYNVLLDKDVFIINKFLEDHQVTQTYAHDDPYVQNIML